MSTESNKSSVNEFCTQGSFRACSTIKKQFLLDFLRRVLNIRRRGTQFTGGRRSILGAVCGSHFSPIYKMIADNSCP